MSLQRQLTSWSACAAGCLAFACAIACTVEPPPPGLAAAVFTLEAPFDEPVALVPLAWEERHQMKPVGGETRRALRCLEVLDVHRLRIEGDRGEEIVVVEGLGGRDERLPQELDRYLVEVAGPAAMDWLTQAGTQLFEVAGPLYRKEGTRGGPSLPSVQGPRFVTLERRSSERPAEEGLAYHEVARERGWSYPSSAHTDDLALDPRLAFVDEEPCGLFTLFSVRALVADYLLEGQAWLALTPEELQQRGRAAQERVARTLDWSPEAELAFRRIDEEEAVEVFTRGTLNAREGVRAWLTSQAQALVARIREGGEEATFEITVDVDPVEEAVTGMIARLNGYSPAGEVIWLLDKPTSPALFEAVLEHEIVHQYQEEFALPDYFPHPGLPVGMGEAHAEWLAGSVRRREQPGRRAGTMDYRRDVRLFDFLVRELGHAPQEVLEAFLSEEWKRERWNEVHHGEATLQEWVLLELGHSRWDGVRFEAVAEAEQRPTVRVTNVGQTALDAQFHGIWIWTFESEEESGSTTLSGPPFNLVLAPGQSVTLRISDKPLWQERAPIALTGLFSRTLRPEN